MKDFIVTYATIFKETGVAWFNRNAPQRAASVAFFAAFTLAPLLVVLTGVFGLMMSQETLRETLLEEINYLAGSRASELARELLINMSDRRQGLWGTVLGIVVSIFAATTLFSQLQHQMNQMWDVKPRPGIGFLVFLRSRVLSFGFILVLGFLLLVSLIIDAALAGFEDTIRVIFPSLSGMAQWGNLILWFGIAILLFAGMFKFLPDVRIRWRDTLPGAVVTAVLFSIGRHLVGIYLGKSAAVSAYGAAGSLAIILFWVFYSCLVFLFGAQFCRIYTQHKNRHVRAKSYAVKDGQ